MPLRPISFSIPSTTELKITFSDKLSLSLNALNFSVECLSGEGKDLEIYSVAISDKSAIITTYPQSAGSYYVLHLISPEENPFQSQSGDALINDDISRAVYFVGITNINPIRDSFLASTPKLFETSNSLLSDVLTAQSEEYYTAQKKIGQLLSDNYISIDVKDEVRTRTSGPSDRLANENAYEIYRVASQPTSTFPESKILTFSSSFDAIGRSAFPYYPIALQEEIVEEESITLNSGGSSFKNLVFTLSKSNLTKILAVSVVKNGATIDCRGDIGTAYDIEKYRYSLLSNKYDPEFAFSNRSLESNQFGLSYFSNLPQLEVNDKIIVRYAYRNVGELVVDGSLSIYSIVNKQNEAVPTNTTRFFLSNAPVVDSDGATVESSGVVFTYGENSSEVPDAFKKELKFNISRLPSAYGEFSINYETGEVFVFGTIDESGTGRSNIFADYLYKQTYKENVDYFISDNDIVAARKRDIIGSDVFVSFNYELVYAKDIDYVAKSHIECIEEQVENRLATSFGVKVKNTPITDVFKISNQTTGEIYNLLYHNKDTIYFYGNKSPKVSSIQSEGANFAKASDELLEVIGEFVSPAFEIQITDATSRTNIQFAPAIPAELISYLTQDYVLRGDISEDDRSIIFFGAPDGDNLISSLAIPADADLPSLSTYLVGVRTLEVRLQNAGVLNSENTAIGNFANTSVELSESDIFIREKFYNDTVPATFAYRDDNGYNKNLTSTDIVKANLSKIRKAGDYCVDYEYGKIYVGVTQQQDLNIGAATYSYRKVETLNSNVLFQSGVVKKQSPAQEDSLSVKNYEQIYLQTDGFTINDIEPSIEMFDPEIVASVGDTLEVCNIVRSDYTAVVANKIISIDSILLLDDLFGKDLDSVLQSDRYQEASSLDLAPITEGGRNFYQSDKVSFSENIIDFKCYEKRRAFSDGTVYSFDILDGFATEVYKVIRYSTGQEITNPSLAVTIVDGNIHVEFDLAVPITPGEVILVVYLTTCTPDIGSDLAVDYNKGTIFASYSYLYDQVAVSYEYGDNSIEWINPNAIYQNERYYVSYKYGALRNALRQNFGILTDIPIFREFPLTFDRELYRDALRGTLQAFAKGPTIPAYKELVKTIADTEPEIIESALSSWIAGRDNVYPGNVYYNGNLKFSPAKYNEGLLCEDGTSVWIPAASNLSINEGTFSAWISPNWDGVSNDASLTFDLKNITTAFENGLKLPTVVRLVANMSPFDQGWNLIPVDCAGYIEQKSGFTYVSNFESYNDGTPTPGEDEIKVAQNGMLKTIEHLNLRNSLKLQADFKVDFIGSTFNDLVYAGASDTFAKLTDPSDVIYTPFSFINNDGTRFFGLDFNLRKLVDSVTGAPFEFTITPADVSTDLVDYSDPISSPETTIPAIDDIENALVRIDLSANSELSDAISDLQVVNNSAKSFIVVDQAESFYQVVKFANELDEEVETAPQTIKAIYVKHWPINKTQVKTLSWVNAAAYLPQGKITLLAKTVDLVLGNTLDSQAHLSLNAKPKLVNWSDKKNYSIDKRIFLRSPTENRLDFSIIDSTTHLWRAYYTDSADIADLAAHINFVTTDDIGPGIMLSCYDSSILSSCQISNLSFEYTNRFTLQDIYIGATGYHPAKPKFTLSKNDYPKICVGMPNQAEDQEGIFIWYDELAQSPLTEKLGQWIIRTRCNKVVRAPTDYNVIGNVEVSNKFIGTIATNGEYSSVVRSSRMENNVVEDGSPLQIHYRFYGNDKIESSGWYRVEESDSLIINSGNSGRDSGVEHWTKSGTFSTNANSGVYRMGASNDTISSGPFSGNTVYTENILPNGNAEFQSSLKVFDVDETCATSEAGHFDWIISGSYTGIVPLNISTDVLNAKLALAFSESGDELVCFIDGASNTILDIIPYTWNDSNFHDFKLQITQGDELVKVYIDSILLSQKNFSDFEQASGQPYLAIHLMDASLVDSELFHSLYSPNIIDIDLVEFNANKYVANDLLESDDIFISDSKSIEFEFINDSGQDTDIDEILISSDKNKYIFDSAKEAARSRISLLKDGRGFLNLRVVDDFGTPYNIAYNAKSFEKGKLYHVAASWRLNSFNKKDEMHLFVDGQEVPSIYRFGGSVHVKVNAKFSDISEETLQNFLVRSLEFSESYTDGQISSLSSSFSSASVTFTEEWIGRSVIIEPVSTSGYPIQYVGKQLIISAVDSGAATLSTGSSLTPIVFESSYSNVKFTFPPVVGLESHVYTDLRNSKFSILRTDVNGDTSELGGILYEVVDNQINILSGANVSNPLFRANVDSRLIEFIGEDSSCDFSPSVESSDIDIHIRTYGLNSENVNKIVELPECSYGVPSGRSILTIASPEPISLDDVLITRILLRRTVVNPESVDPDNISSSTITFEPTDFYHLLTSQSGATSKSDLGRSISIRFDSDNVDFSEFSGDETVNIITVYGQTVDGSDFEKFVITNNGVYAGEKIFYSISSVETVFKIIDVDYEVCTIEITETNPISISENDGDSCEIFDWENGSFVLTKVGTSGYMPFELHAGFYKITYPAHLTIPLREVGGKISLGCDIFNENSLNGVLEEVKISNEMLTDVRSYEIWNGENLSVTYLYNKQTPNRPEANDLALIHFDNPIIQQARVLRRKVFLDAITNSKFKLTQFQQDALLSVVNNQIAFTNLMFAFGFNEEIAERTYFEVHKAYGGPLFNEAAFRNNNIEWVPSSTSVNSKFGNSAKFDRTKGVRFDNSSLFFRKDKGTIEFWISPLTDTHRDKEKRYYVDIYASSRQRVQSLDSTTLSLDVAAKEILSVKLIRKGSADSIFYTSDESNSILFDNIQRSEITGELFGGSGVDKDFSLGYTLSADGYTVELAEALPGAEIDVIVSYIPKDSNGDRFSIFKDEKGMLIFYVKASGVENVVTRRVDWKKHTWHRILCSWKTGTSSDTMKMFIDGIECGYIRFGESLLLGIGAVYGTISSSDDFARIHDYTMTVSDDFGFVTIGSDAFGEYSADARIDNMRFSRDMRKMPKDSLGAYVDLNYSANTETIYPVVSDDLTTKLIDFEPDDREDSFIQVVNQYNGIFDFDINVFDGFDKVIDINDGVVEDLIIDLVNKLKPAHSNAYVKFFKP